MNFTELEKIMNASGVASLAEIARNLETTPQAVSNWKARNQVPYHVVNKIRKINSKDLSKKQRVISTSQALKDKESISFSDILIIIAEQLKVLLLIPFLTIFLTFTYVQFIKKPLYSSSATILLPDSNSGSLGGGLAGLASQFGVNIPSSLGADLSSPVLFPELIRSRTFSEKLLDKTFFIDKYQKELSLIEILNYEVQVNPGDKERLIANSMEQINGGILSFNTSNTFSYITIKAFEPVFAKELADLVISELNSLNKEFKSKKTREKTIFISNRIKAVNEDLKNSEMKLKNFKEQNRQISSPALQLEQGRLELDFEVQKEIYTTLKQQLELAKIEIVQNESILQILDRPQIPLGPSNKNLKTSIILSLLIGLGLGFSLAFIRAYFNTPDISERKKHRRMKNFIKKKGKDFLADRRISGIISLSLLSGLPFYLGHKSQSPIFFGMYSLKLLLVNIVYILF
jgi:uncharacterized protein involved in exopolysaccharide biosynthesis